MARAASGIARLAALGVGIALALPAAAAPGPGAGQEAARPAAQEPEESELERLLRAARSGSGVVRPQAARRLAALGAPAAQRLLDLAGETPRELAELGADLVEVLGELGEPRLRARLWAAADEPDFPWRPAAVRSLAAAPEDGEAERFAALLADRLPPVRAAAVEALRALDLRERKDALEGLLDDENDRVRRAAALVLDEWGERWALRWLVEELRRDDRFFHMPTGQSARHEAYRALVERLGERFEYDLAAPADAPENLRAVAALEERVRERAGERWPELPPVARAAAAPDEQARIGLELRSCRAGELFLRWTAGDRLLVGTGNPAVVELPPGTVAELLARIEPLLAELGEQRFWGEPGCDLETFHWAAEGERARTLLLSKGPDPVPDLRPAPLDAVVRLLAESVPAGGEDPRTRDLAGELRAGLAAVGGPVGER